MSLKMDSSSMCSSIPSSSSLGPKKRGFSRLSFRRLFYSNPFVNQQRLASRRKRSANTAAAEIEVSGDGSFSSHTANTEVSVPAKDTLQSIQTSITPSQIPDGVGEDTSLSSQSLFKANTSRLLECPLCLSELPIECFPPISSCPHRSCYDCLKQYLRIEITESRVNISCPECTEPIHPTDLRMILNNESLMGKYEDFMLRRVLVSEPDARWCPAPDCSYAVIASGCASCPKLKCERPGCNTYFCYHCKQEWHPNQTCDAARAQRSPNVRSSSVSFSQDSAAQRDDIKSCPRCQVLIVKMDDGSCNHMTCAVCGAEFCWLCMKEISDLHYLSPSGCTFWGKKPWSRKKKILWQLGTLVGAPVGIGLVAGIAVPAMIIGIPVWVGRKLHARFEHASKHKRNLAITGGVTASILVSPILAGLAVGIGVPILLAYVYGVVPISLCRSGGCGVTTSASGVRIEFDDENDLTGANGQAPDEKSVDTSSHRVANPSIGEVSFGMSASLSMGSGSHLERIGLIRDSDRESASNTAIAGASLTGSIISSMTGATTGHRLEVQADVSSNKRFSFSSETASATVSLSERSATFSVADDASTKALAGSILGYRDGSSTSCTPVEVHMDPSIHGPLYMSHEDAYIQARADGLSLHEDIAIAAACCQNPHDVRGKSSKQVNLNMREDHCSYRITCDDAVSEKVRFDDNVSFIDDPPLEEVRVAPAELSERHLAPRSYLINSSSWHEGVVYRSSNSHSSAANGHCSHTVEAVAEINLAAIGNGNTSSAERPVKSVLSKRHQKMETGVSSSGGPECENFLPVASVLGNEDMEAAVAAAITVATTTSDEAKEQDASQECSQLSLPLDTDLERYPSVSWATHQSMPCILDTEQSCYTITDDVKQI